MTIWDEIYKNKKKNSDNWATPSEKFYPIFKLFLGQSDFKNKHALDIGCGAGKYLKILQTAGFRTDGIDSSETSIEMTKELLGDDSGIFLADMYEYEIPKNKYDLVISILTIHHGTKEQVRGLVDRIYEAISDSGKIFITLHDLESSRKWNNFKDHKKIAEGTFVPLLGPEKGLVHSFYTKEEIQELFSKFKDLILDIDDEGNWIVRGVK